MWKLDCAASMSMSHMTPQCYLWMWMWVRMDDLQM
jgi:hypothetical protein